MSPEQFAYWLQGFVELNAEHPTAAQWKSIREHLATVFHKVTPPVGEHGGSVESKIKIDVDTKGAQKAVEDLTEVLRRYQEITKPSQPWPFGGSPVTITC
jgi:hypothetical protein